MSDELERLEAALRADPPQAPGEARARAQAAALAAFDRHHQGIGDEVRRTGRVADRATSWLRRLVMSFSRPYPALAGVAALVIVAGVVFYQTVPIPGPEDLNPGPASLDRAEAEGPAGESLAEPLAQSAPSSAGRVEVETASDEEFAALLAEALVQGSVEKAAPGSVIRSFQAEAQRAPADTLDALSPGYRDQGRDQFAAFDPNPVKVVAEEPVSTFSIDVDTASYAFMRASLNQGVLPQPDAVRVEELINYFPYDYAPPESRARPFATHVSLLPTPWNDATRLLHIGIKGYALTPEVRPPANLVFLIDSSGSMDAPNKLPLLVNSLKLLLGALAPEDTVAIVTYAGWAGTVLAPTPVAERGAIVAALETLWAEGSTAGAEGIRQAYLLAEQHFVEDGVNRVILATDGDFNVGITDPDELEGYIARKRAGGVFLSVLGFGMGNYNDALMQRLAQNGNGTAAYIDTLSEARKVLVEEATSTLFPIARDVKIQVEFTPALVSEYRLIGYETRMLNREDFRNDKVDAGEIGAGHTVTALYEVTPAGAGAERIAPLRYGEDEETAAPAGRADELATVAIRYKLPEGETSTEIARHVTVADMADSATDAPADVRFAAAVAAFGQLLRGGRYTEDYDYDDVIAAAQAARGEDAFGYRTEFVNLVRLARTAAAMERLQQ